MRRHGGFTMVELLVVIAIIGVLAGILLPALMAGGESAKRGEAASTINAILVGMDAMKDHYGYAGLLATHSDGTVYSIEEVKEQLLIERELDPMNPAWVGEWDTEYSIDGKLPIINKKALSEADEYGREWVGVMFFQCKRKKIRNMRFNDPWGKPYRYIYDDFTLESSEGQSRRYYREHVISAGADGEFRTEDDISNSLMPIEAKMEEEEE